MLGDEIDLARVHHLGDDGQSSRRAHLREHTQRFFAKSLKSVRRRARLERAAAQERRAGVAHGGRRHVEHLAALDRTGAGDHGDRRAAERRVPVAAADLHDGAIGRELARRQLVRFQDRRDRLHAGERAKRNLLEQRLVADAADDRAVLAAREVRAHAGRLDALANVVDLGVGDFGAGDDDHLTSGARGVGRGAHTARGLKQKRPVKFTGRRGWCAACLSG